MSFSCCGENGLCCSTPRGIFPVQGSNPHPLHRQADSLPLDHWGRPCHIGFNSGLIDCWPREESRKPGVRMLSWKVRKGPGWWRSRGLSVWMQNDSDIYWEECVSIATSCRWHALEMGLSLVGWKITVELYRFKCFRTSLMSRLQLPAGIITRLLGRVIKPPSTTGAF